MVPYYILVETSTDFGNKLHRINDLMILSQAEEEKRLKQTSRQPQPHDGLDLAYCRLVCRDLPMVPGDLPPATTRVASTNNKLQSQLQSFIMS